MKVVMVAGESSGDALGENLILALKRHFPGVECVGIGGPKMQAAGLTSWFPMETLSVMGFGNVLLRLPKLLRVFHALMRRIQAFAPDVYIGIDAPDFNLRVERRLKAWLSDNPAQVQTKIVHYVSPSIWAWRYDRIFDLKASTDLVLCLLPFEEKLYRDVGHRAVFVGHPLARRIPLATSSRDTLLAREGLNLPTDRPLMGLLPGSRTQEVKRLLPLFLETFAQVKRRFPDALAVLPVAHAGLWPLIRPYSAQIKSLGVFCVEGKTDAALTAVDVALVASGTAVLESVLHKKPTVVAYTMGWLFHAIVRALVTAPYASLPNLLAYWGNGEKDLVPEFIQHDATAERLSEALVAVWEGLRQDTPAYRHWLEVVESLHRELALDSGEVAAQTIQEVLSC